MEYKESNFNIWKMESDTFLVYNTFSKALIKFSSNEYQNLKSNLENKKFNKTFIDLEKQGILVDSSIDEIKLLEYRYLNSYFSTDNLFITLMPTLKCNFKCPYCFETEKNIAINNENLEILKKFSSKNFKYKKLIHITMFGGEPLLEKKGLFEYFDFVLDLQKKYGFYFDTSIGTNGYLLDEKTINLLVGKYNCKTFQISIDGNKNSHDNTRKLKNGNGTYDEIIKNFKKLILKNIELANGIDPKLRINLLNNTQEDIQILLKEFSNIEKKYFSLYFRPIYNTINFFEENLNRKNLEHFYTLARDQGFKINNNLGVKNNYCEGDSGKNQIQIMPDLSIWKCINDLNVAEAKIGHLDREGNLILKNNYLEKWSRNNPFNDEDCKSCKMLPICFGGCPLYYLKNNKRSVYMKKILIFSILQQIRY